MAQTFTLTVGAKIFGDQDPPRIGVKVWPIADSTSQRKLKYIKDTAGNSIITGHAEAKATPQQLAARSLSIAGLPDPRDTTYGPSGFGLLVEVDAFYFRQTFMFGATEIAAHINAGVVQLEDVIEADIAAFAATVGYATANDVATGDASTLAAAKAYSDAHGGSVASVNSKTGAVVLSASDVGADASGAATSAQSAAIAAAATDATSKANAAQAAAVQRANHTGTQSADTLTDGTTNKAFLVTERTKLGGIATGATANSTDAQLRDRATHTGTQAQSTVTNLVSDLAAKLTSTNARPVVRLGLFTEASNPNSEAEFVAVTGEPVTVELVAYNYLTQPNVSALTALNARGVTPMVTWMPNGATEGTTNPSYRLSTILGGTFDSYMTTFLNTIKGLGFPVMLKWAPEMNGDWAAWSEGQNGNTTGQFAQAWRYVHDLAVSLGVTNAIWCWSPTTKFASSTPLAGLYPGDAYVDMVAVHGYNYGAAGPDGLRYPSAVYDPTFDEIAGIVRGKPLWLGECGTVDTSGEKAAWFGQFFDWIIARGLAGFVYFNSSNVAEGYDWRVNSSTAASTAFAAGLAKLRKVSQATGKAVAQADGRNNWTGTQDFRGAQLLGLTTPAHAASHATGASDPVTPDSIGAAPANILTNWFTSSMTLAIWQANRQMDYDSASPGVATVPTDAAVAFPVGTRIWLFQNNTGQLTITASGGVTIVGLGTGAVVGRGGKVCLTKLDVNYWALDGDLTGSVTKAMVGLGSVDNTADTAKPVSTAQQTALNLKADKVETINTVATSGAAQTIPDPATAATISRITLSANCTLTFPTAAAGKSLTVLLVQDATGSRTVTWPATVKWPGGTTPTLTTTASRRDAFTFVCTDGTNWDGFTAGLNFA